MCGIGGILRIVKPGDPDYPADADDPRREPSGAWLWHGLDVRDLAYSCVDTPAASLKPQASSPSWLIPESWLDAIDDNIKWRGPDGAGRFRDRVIRPDGSIVEVALVHRRLSIIDIEGGAQPMVVTKCPRCAEKALGTRHEAIDGKGYAAASQTPSAQCQVPLAAIVFNGCIYNHRELRAELEAKGHVFESDHSDTEVILHAARESPEAFGADAFGDPAESAVKGRPTGSLDGMFGLAVWDRCAANLVLARDRHGEKPLFSLRDDSTGVLQFSSSVGALVECDQSARPSPIVDWWPMAIRPSDSYADWIALGWSAEGLPFNSICENWRSASWFDEFASPSTPIGVKGFIQIVGVLGFALLCGIVFVLLVVGAIVGLLWLLGLLASAGLFWLLIKLPVPWIVSRTVRTHWAARATCQSVQMLGDVLDEAVLSRLDSDVPLGCFLSGGVDSSLIAHYAQSRLGNLTTITVRMPDKRYDESHYSALVAAHLGTHHVILDCNAESAANDLIHIIETLRLPLGDSSVLPSYWLCRAAREHVKVALAGDGGDELFFGYDRYKAIKYLDPRRFVLRLFNEGTLDRSDPRSASDRKARLIIAARHKGYTDLAAIFPTPDRVALFGRAVGQCSRRGVFEGVAAARTFDLQHYLPGDLLRKVDTASMMCGVEVRCPFLAPAVANFALSIPARIHMKGGETKHLLKELARKHLPREIVDRPKQGFAIPISDWWRNNFGGLQDLLLDMLAGDRPFGRVHDVLEINMDFVRQMLDEHWAAGGLTPLHTTRHVRKRDHGQRLFALVSLAIWARSVHHRDAEKDSE